MPRSKRKRNKLWSKLLLLAVGLYLGLNAAMAYKFLHRGKPGPEHPSFESVKVKSEGHEDVCYLTSRLAKGDPKIDKVIVFVHGLGGSPEQFFEPMKKLQARGIESITVPLQGHAGNGDPLFGLGMSDATDVISVVKWVRERIQVQGTVGVYGVSLGGTAAWYATAREPKLIDFTVSEGAIINEAPMMDKWLDSYGPFGHVWLSPMTVFCRLMTGIKPSDVNLEAPLSRVRPRRGLVIHGRLDEHVPMAQGRLLANVSGAPFWEAPHSSHLEALDKDGDEVISKLVSLFAK